MVRATAPVVPGLRDESREYAQRLREAGAPVTERCHTGHIHPFSNVPGVGRTGRAPALVVGDINQDWEKRGFGDVRPKVGGREAILVNSSFCLLSKLK